MRNYIMKFQSESKYLVYFSEWRHIDFEKVKMILQEIFLLKKQLYLIKDGEAFKQAWLRSFLDRPEPGNFLTFRFIIQTFGLPVVPEVNWILTMSWMSVLEIMSSIWFLSDDSPPDKNSSKLKVLHVDWINFVSYKIRSIREN